MKKLKNLVFLFILTSLISLPANAVIVFVAPAAVSTSAAAVAAGTVTAGGEGTYLASTVSIFLIGGGSLSKWFTNNPHEGRTRRSIFNLPNLAILAGIIILDEDTHHVEINLTEDELAALGYRSPEIIASDIIAIDSAEEKIFSVTLDSESSLDVQVENVIETVEREIGVRISPETAEYLLEQAAVR